MDILSIQCDFERLVKYLDKKLNLDEQLELFNHLDRCENCREVIYQISRDRDAALFVVRPYKLEKIPAG